MTDNMEETVSDTYGTLEGGREILLTFDDGPHPELTPPLLDLLKERGILAVFFVLGKRVDTQAGREIVERAFEEGHTIGNHTYSHPVLTKRSEDQVREEISRTEELIADYLGDHKLFRPPYGAHNSMVDRVVRELGYNMMLWNVDPEDWNSDLQPTDWIDRAVEGVKNRGDVTLLCHDIQRTTVNNFPALLDELGSLPEARFVECT